MVMVIVPDFSVVPWSWSSMMFEGVCVSWHSVYCVLPLFKSKGWLSLGGGRTCVCVFVRVSVCVCVCDAWLVSVVPLHMGSFHLRQFPDMLFRQSSWVGVGTCFRCCRASLELIVYDGWRCDVLFKQSCGFQRCWSGLMAEGSVEFPMVVLLPLSTSWRDAAWGWCPSSAILQIPKKLTVTRSQTKIILDRISMRQEAC